VAYLRVLSIQGTDHLPDEKEWQWIRGACHHVCALLLLKLPKFDLNGCARLTILFGPPEGGRPEYSELLGTSALYLPDRDPAEVSRVSGVDRSEFALSLLQSSIAGIASRKGRSELVERLEQACREIREDGYAGRIPVRKLRRKIPGGPEVRVFRRLSPSRGEHWEVVVSGVDERTHSIPMGEAATNDLTEVYKFSRVEEGAFLVQDRLRHETFRLDLSPWRRSNS